ncbi:MAG: hypothetical protein M3Z35_02855, partial [Nitrospirota bacterium]|nr:hypothetical protein [Nitrospirota bacterium]
PLFNSTDKQQGTPAAAAKAITQMNKGVNPAAAKSSSVAGVLKTFLATDSGASYIAYPDLPSIHYSPTNAQALRNVDVIAPIGLSFSVAWDGTPNYQEMDHADARDAIDAMQGEPWTSGESAVQTHTIHVGSWWSDFWHWLTHAVEEVIQVVVSVAEDIYVGIKLAAGQIFRAIVKVVDDVVNAIGSFFKMLKKLIEDVIEALSILFHFGEIMKTQAWILGQINTILTQTLPNQLNNTVIPAINTAFQRSEADINAVFAQMRASIAGNPQPINTMKGAGSTPHTAFKVTSKDGTTKSHAVHSTWALQKMKSAVPSAGSASSTANVRQSGPPSVLSDFISDFGAAINGGNLATAWDAVSNSGQNLLSSHSASDFFKTLLVTLLDIIQALTDTALVVVNGFVSGFLGAIAGATEYINGIITAPLDIPFFSWLYQLLFNQDLTFLNLVTLIVAIPVTFLYTLIEGHYPSQDFGQSADALDQNMTLYGLMEVVTAIGIGIVDGISDKEKNMGFGFRSIEHAFASVARDLVKTANIFSLVASRIEKAAPEIEAITGAIYPPAVLMERAAFGLLGAAAHTASSIEDASKAHGINIALDEQSIKELQQIATYLKTRVASFGELGDFDHPASAKTIA